MGVLDTIVTGGVDSPITPLILRGFQLMHIMSTSWNKEPTRASRPFFKDRDGFVLAEGSWFFVMEEMERAKARGAHIYGEIAGYGSACEASHRVRLEECGEEPARAIGICLKEGGIAPTDVQYIHYHGTSTELNDRIETRAVKLAFEGPAYKLPGSSLKSMIGHPQGACGAAGTRGAPADPPVSPPPCSPCATAWSRPPSMWTNRTPTAIWITCPTSGASSTSSTPSPTASPSAARTPPCCCAGCNRAARDCRSEERRVGKECRSRWSP